MSVLEPLVFFIASLISIGLIYFQVPKSALFVVLSMLIAGLLVFFGKFQINFLQKNENRVFLLLALFVCALFIQILLIATGGFFSAFIIVLHLFTLAMSLILNVRSSIFFLLISVGVLSSMIFFDPQTVLLFKQDPWSFLLHGVSFLVVIPLAHMMVSTYHLKDAITKVLSEHLKTKELQDESIFRGIGEFVLILNKELKVIFANEAMKKSLGLENGEIINKNALDLLPIKSSYGEEVTTKTLSIDQAIADRSAHIVRGFYFASKQGSKKLQVTIQVRPIYETNGDLKQLILVMTTDKAGVLSDKVDLKVTKARRELLENELEKELKVGGENSLIHYSLLMEQISDQLLYDDLETHGINENKMLINLADFITSFITKMQKLTTPLGIAVDFVDTQEGLVKLATESGTSEYSLYTYAKKNILASVDSLWLEEIFRRIFKLCLLVGLNTNKKILIRIGFNDNGELVVVFAVSCPMDIGFASQELLLQNYGSLEKHPSLMPGSGIEGVLLQKITDHLDYPLNLRFDQKSAILVSTIKLPTELLQKPDASLS